MQIKKDLKDFKVEFNELEKAIQFNDLREINNHINSIKAIEKLFLNNYDAYNTEGVYFTSEEIADFIFSKSLLLFLNEKINDLNLKILDDVFKIEKSNQERVLRILKNIKICDPACGSGVFLLSAAKIIFNLMNRLNPQINESDLKNEILNNIIGYDINKYGIIISIIKLYSWFCKNKEELNIETLSILKKNLIVKNSIILSENFDFDLIVGNPPYGNILSYEEKNNLKKEKVYYNDIYCAFLLKAVNWCNGIIGFLVPKSFLLRQNYSIFRNQFLDKAYLLEIYDIGSKLFKKATNEVQIVLYERKKEKMPDLKIYDYPDKYISIYKNQKVDSLNVCFNNKCPLSKRSKKIFVYTFEKKCPFCGFETSNLNRIRIKHKNGVYQIIQKIEKSGDMNFINIEDFPKMIRGEEDKGLKEIRKIVKKDINGTCYFVNAKDDFKYYYLKKNKSFNIEEISPNLLKGNYYEYYTSPKLLIKHNNIIPEAVYTTERICFTSSIYSILHDNMDELKVLCAFLNSVLIQFYCFYGINNQKDTTINLNQYMIRHIPIIKPSETVKKKLINNVEQIQTQLYNNHGEMDSDIAHLCQEIDNIIFSMYNFEKVEQKLVLSAMNEQILHFKKVYQKN